MAGIAGHAAGVLGRHDLRKPFRLALIGLVAAGAEDLGFGELRNDGGGVFGVFGLGTMAGLTADVGVFSFALDLGLVGVADLASLAAGELHGTRANIVHGAGPEVAVLAEVTGDDQMAYDQEGNDAQGEQDGDANEVFGVPEDVLHAGELRKLLSRLGAGGLDPSRSMGDKALAS